MKWQDESDFIVVGSGAAGATAAFTLADAGHNVLILEEGGWVRRENFSEDLYGAMKSMFRDFGATTTRGRSVMPILEGRCVGGSTVMNGAIVHRLPEAIWREWAEDKAIAEHLAFSEIENAAEEIETYLEVRRNVEAQVREVPVTGVLDRLGWEHEAMLRNAPGCQNSGRCLQGCPTGGKWSMELTYVPRAMQAGARVYPHHRVDRIIVDKGTTVGVAGRNERGESIALRARRGVVLAAGVMHSPRILKRSGLGGAAVGRHFQCHLGVGMVGLHDRSVTEIEGPPQGIEITQFNGERIKLATQLVPPDVLFARSPLLGTELVSLLADTRKVSSWMGSIRSTAEGSLGRFGLHFEPTENDLCAVRKALWRMAQLQFELGARRVFPGIQGKANLPFELTDVSQIDRLLDLPLDAKNYLLSAGHLFGTCRLGGDPADSVVGMDFAVHGVRGAFVVDASVFPSNTGVNPQHAIMSLATVAARRIANH